MSDTVSIDHEPPVIHHTGLPIGVGHEVRWGFGEADHPEALDGRAAWIVLHPGTNEQFTQPLIVMDDWVVCPVDAVAARLPAAYALLVERLSGGPREVRARGTLEPGTICIRPEGHP